MKSNETIKAIRGGKIRFFPIQMWRNLPKDKLGWQPYAEMPSEVEQHLNKKNKLTEDKQLSNAKEFLKENIATEDEPIDLLNEGLEIKDSEGLEVKKRGRKPKEI